MSIHRRRKVPKCNSHIGNCRRVGSFAHADNNNEAFVTKGSTRSVNTLEILAVGRLRIEPTFASRALRALHHLHEVGTYLLLTTAPATGCTKPGSGGAFNVWGVDLPHLFDDLSIDVEIQFAMIVDHQVAYLPVKVLHFRGWLS